VAGLAGLGRSLRRAVFLTAASLIAAGIVVSVSSVHRRPAPAPKGPTTRAAVTVPGLQRVRAIAMGGAEACAVRADRTIACWGDIDPYGGRIATRPTAIAAVTGVTDVAVDETGGAACAIAAPRALRCWGETQIRFDPRRVLRTVGASAAVGETPGCIADAGTVTCLDVGERADGSVQLHASRPMWLQGATRVVSTEEDTRCGLFATGTVTCAVIEEGDPGTYYDPARLTIHGFTHVATLVAFDRDVCALRAGRTVACWDGEAGQRGKAKDVPALDGATALSEGRARLCAVVDGRVRCVVPSPYEDAWNDRATVYDVPGVTDATAVAFGDEAGCALRRGGTVVCWGNRADGRLGGA
jgi:hypothetical protein